MLDALRQVPGLAVVQTGSGSPGLPDPAGIAGNAVRAVRSRRASCPGWGDDRHVAEHQPRAAGAT